MPAIVHNWVMQKAFSNNLSMGLIYFDRLKIAVGFAIVLEVEEPKPVAEEVKAGHTKEPLISRWLEFQGSAMIPLLVKGGLSPELKSGSPLGLNLR